MAGFGEPWEWTTDRNQRMESEYPELANTSADDVLGTDNYAVSQGRAPTQFSSTAMGLGAHSVVPKETEDNSWWGAIKRAGSSILALDTPISERLGYKVPEGSGPADELANFALEESTRPSNIVLALGGLLTGGISTAGAATKVSLGAAAKVATRAAAKNVAMGVGGRVAATGVEKVAEYAPEEIGPLAALASAGAGLYATRGRSGLTRGAAALAAGGVGYASPELAGGIAGGVLTSKAIGGFSSWKEAANSIDSRAATQAETQAAQLLEQAEVSKQRMRDLAAAERRGETRIASDQMPEIPMGQQFENNLLGEVAYKTGGDDASRRAARRTAPEVKPNEELLTQDAARAAAKADAQMPVLAKYEAALRANNSGPLSPSERTVRFGDMQEADAVEAIRQEAPSSGRVINASTSSRDPKNLMGIDERGEVYRRSKGGGIVSKWDDATKKFVRRPVVKFDPNAYQPQIDWKVGVEFPATAVDDTASQVAAQADVARFAAEDAARAAPPPAQVAAQAEAAAPAARASAARAAEPANRIVEPVPVAVETPKAFTFKPLSKAQEKALAESEDIRSAFYTNQVSDIDSFKEIPEGAIGKDRLGGFWRFKNGKAQRFNEYRNQFSSKVKREDVDTIEWSKYSPDDAIQNAPAVEPPIARVETPAAPAAAQQVDTPVTPAAGGGGEVPPPPPRETATGGAPEFKGTPQSSRSFPTWGDDAAHNEFTAKTIPIIDQYRAAAAETTESVAAQNKKLQDVANRQAEKVRIAALDEGKTKLEANLLWLEEWNKANSGERIKPEFDLPLGLSDRDADRIKESFVNAMRANPDNLFIVYRVKEATPALAAITGKGPLAYKSQYDALSFWINAMSPEEELAYLKNQYKNSKGGFNPKNAQLLKDKAKLLNSKLGFTVDDIADDVPVGNQAVMSAADEAVAPRQTGERTASTTGEPTAPRETIIPANDTSIGVNDAGDPLFQRADGSVYRMRSDSPTTRPNGYPDFGGDLAPATNAAPSPGAARAEAAAALPDAEAPRATGKGGGATGGGGKGAGKGGGDEGGGASSTGDDIEGVPEANDYGKSFRKSEQEIKEARGVNTFWNILTDVLAAPRSLKASFDLSGAGRQAAPYGYSHPGQALKAFKAQLKAYGSEAGYQESVERLANKPWADIRNEVVANSLVDQPLLNGERTFISKGLNKVPGFRASERAYATYLNELRDSAFEMMWRNSGLSLEELTSVANVPKVKAWGDLINAATGHGDIGTLFNAKVAGNPILWAPNFLYSRVKLPWIALTQWHKNPEVALEAAKQLGIFVGVNSALLAGVNASGAASVELDPRSSDFGQMRIGNSRIDPWAGYRPIANLVARLQSGETKSTTTGDISDPTNLKIVQDFLRNKMEPLSGELLNQILGSNSIGEPTVADTNMAIRLVAPLFLESMVRAINVGGPSVTPSENFSDQIASFGRNVTSPGGLKAAALTLPGVVGVGTATYEPLIKKMDRATLDRMSPQERNKFGTNEQRGLANLTPAEQQKAIPALAFRQMYEYIPSARQELSNYGSFSGFKRDKIREYAEYYMDLGVSKANAVLRAEQYFQNSGYQQIYQQNVNTLKYQWSEAHPGELAEEIEETYTINPRDRTFRPNAIQKAMAEPYLQKR